MVSAPLHESAFMDCLSTVEPIRCNRFEEVLLLGDCRPFPEGDPLLVEVPVILG